MNTNTQLRTTWIITFVTSLLFGLLYKTIQELGGHWFPTPSSNGFQQWKWLELQFLLAFIIPYLFWLIWGLLRKVFWSPFTVLVLTILVPIALPFVLGGGGFAFLNGVSIFRYFIGLALSLHMLFSLLLVFILKTSLAQKMNRYLLPYVSSVTCGLLAFLTTIYFSILISILIGALFPCVACENRPPIFSQVISYITQIWPDFAPKSFSAAIIVAVSCFIGTLVYQRIGTGKNASLEMQKFPANIS